MAIFSQNISWNRQETALLIDAYLRIKAGEVKKRNAVMALSARLRNRMILNGIEVSEKYRNESGIVMQMSSIDYCFSDGQRGLKPSNVLFPEMCSLYLSDRNQFSLILSQAERMYPSTVTSAQSPKLATQPVQQKPKPSSYSTPHTQQQSFASESSANGYQSDISLEQIKAILSQYFVNGFRLDSRIEDKRFARFYQEKFNKEFSLSSECLKEMLTKCGIVCNGKVFIPEQLLPISLRDEIKGFVDAELLQGKPCVFYEVLFNHFREQLLDTLVSDEEVLHLCLNYFFGSLWHLSQKAISLTGKVRVNVDKEVVNFIKEQGHVVSEDDVVAGLSYLPAEEVRQAFGSNKDKLISCGRKMRFHIRLFVISYKELNIVKSLISNAIKQFRFITADELFSDIQNKIPSLLTNNTSIPDIGIRNALALKLEHLYAFNGPIISDKRDDLSSVDALLAFARRKESYTLEEIDAMSNSLDVPLNPYLKSLLEHSVRISENMFVAANKVSFNPHVIDKAISIAIEGKSYFPIKFMTNFTIFPDCGYPWTQRLLESYLLTNSWEYTLLFSSFLTKNNICGVVVKKNDPRFQKFEDVVAQALADSRIPLTKEKALDFLTQSGYIVQRRYGELNKVLSRANALRIN